MMNNLKIDYINDILSNSFISHKKLIDEILFVNSNPAKVESINISKVDNNIIRSKTTNEYILNSVTSEIKNIDTSTLIFCVSSILDNQFIKSLEFFGSDDLKFYKKGIMSLISKPNPDIIIDEVGEYYDWIITSPKVLKYLSKHKNFESFSDEKSTSIKLKGRVNNLSVFVTDIIDKDIIYKGSSIDCSAIMLNELIINEESNIYTIKVDYLFNNRGIRKLTLV